MFLAEAATQSVHITFEDWVGGFAILGFFGWMWHDSNKREAEADAEFTDAVVEKHALDALVHLSRHWDEREDPISMDDYWRAQPYWQRQRHVDRVRAQFVKFGARPHTQDDGTVRYSGSFYMRKFIESMLERQHHPKQPTASVTAEAGAVVQIGDGNAVSGVSTKITQIERVVAENREAIKSLVDVLAQLAAATEARQSHRAEAATLGQELDVARSENAEAVPGLGRRVRNLAKNVGETATNLAPLVNAINGLLDILQKSGLHL